MLDEDNKILKYNHGEKSMGVPFIIYADLECSLEKCTRVKIILKNLIQRKKLRSILLLVIHCLQIVHFIQRSYTVWKGFVRI